MRTLLITVGFLVGLVSAAVAASPTAPSSVVKNGTSTSSHSHWLSEGLNRLVFWQPPAQTHSERTVRD